MVRRCAIISVAVSLLLAVHLQAQTDAAPPVISNAGPAPAGTASAEPASVSVSTADTRTAESNSSDTYARIENQPIGGARHQGSDAAGSDDSGSGDWIGTTLLSLALVVGLIFAAFVAIKRWGPSSIAGGRGGAVRVLARCPLSPKQQVAVIQVARRLLLVGVTSQQISLLAEVSDEDEMDELLAACSSGKSALGEGFSQLLGRHRGEMTDESRDDAAVDRSAAGRAIGQLSQLIGQVKSKLSGPRSGSSK